MINAIEILSIVLFTAGVTGGLVYWLCGRKQYDLSEEFYDNVADYRNAVLTHIMNYVGGHYNIDDEKWADGFQNDIEHTILVMPINERLLIEAEFNWEKGTYTFTAQGGLEKLFNRRFKGRLVEGQLFDYKRLEKFLGKVDYLMDKQIEFKGMELLEEANQISRQLAVSEVSDESMKELLFTTIIDLGDSLSRRYIRRKVLKNSYIRIFSYVLKNFREDFEDFVHLHYGIQINDDDEELVSLEELGNEKDGE